MWPGPYGNGGSRKYLLASLDQSLRRMGLEYVDIFYHHRPDPDTPLEESMGAIAQAVRQGKALYAGLSNYPPDRTREALALLRASGTPCIIHQVKYSMLERTPEHGLFDVLREYGLGCIVFSPLAQGLLTDRYLESIPADSRAASGENAMQPTPSFSSSFSSPCSGVRWSMLYFGWWITQGVPRPRRISIACFVCSAS